MVTLSPFITGIIGSVIGGFTVLAIRKYLHYSQQKNIKLDIQNLEYEKKHLILINKSKSELNRSSFRALFYILFLFSLAVTVPKVIGIFPIEAIANTADYFSAILWIILAVILWQIWKRYDNLRNLDEALEKIEEKRVKLEKKLALFE